MPLAPQITACPCNPSTYYGGGTLTLGGSALVVPKLAVLLTFGGSAIGDLTNTLWCGYSAVYALSEAGNGSPGEYLDRSPFALSGQGGGGQGIAYVPTQDNGVGCALANEFVGNQSIVLPLDSLTLTAGFTVTCWVSITSFFKARWAYQRGTAPWSIRLGNNVLNQPIAQIQTVDPVGNLSVVDATGPAILDNRGTWYHLSAVWVPGSLSVYVDGVLVASTPVTKPLVNPGGNSLIGQYLYGSLQEVRTCPYPRTQPDLLAEYTSICGGLVQLA